MFILTFALTDLNTNNISRHLVWNEKQNETFILKKLEILSKALLAMSFQILRR